MPRAKGRTRGPDSASSCAVPHPVFMLLVRGLVWRAPSSVSARVGRQELGVLVPWVSWQAGALGSGL